MFEMEDRDPETLFKMIEESCKIKRQVVESDPTEKGERALLNFGHTIGHAIEKAKGFSLYHGECVALGAVAAAYISWKKELLSMEEYYEIRDMFVPFGLPISEDRLDEKEILKLTGIDNEDESGRPRFVLLRGIGQAVPDDTVTKEEILAAIHEIHYVEDGE
jgi:3-dehydroquinate synthase